MRNKLILQAWGAGDILFSQKLANDWVNEGYNVIWGVEPHYVDLYRHFPKVTFVDKSLLGVDYNRKDFYSIGNTDIVPLRWSVELCGALYKDCMKTKYTLFNKNWEDWRDITIARDNTKELQLAKELGVDFMMKYNLVNRYYRGDCSGVAPIKAENNFQTIEMITIPGFTFIDWSLIIENATNIYTPGTSLNYLIELLEVKAGAIHIYKRLPEENHFHNYDYILQKHKDKYIFH